MRPNTKPSGAPKMNIFISLFPPFCIPLLLFPVFSASDPLDVKYILQYALAAMFYFSRLLLPPNNID